MPPTPPTSPPTFPLAIICEPIDPACQAWLAERCEIITAKPGEPEFDAALPRAAALVVRTYTRIDAPLLDRAPNLQVVARAGVAVDNIDLSACAARSVKVVHTPAANTDAVVEYVFALALDALRPRPALAKPLPPEEWAQIRKSAIAPRQLHGSTLGILGLGRIGSRVARVGASFGMSVVFNDLAPVQPPCACESVDLDTLFAQADVLTIHIDNRPSNAKYISAALINRMREHVVFINASRGFVVDHAALAVFLAANPNAHAALDVHDPEPVTESNPLLTLPNARLLPHIGAATRPAHRNMSWVVRDVWRVLSGESPEHPAIIRA